MRRVAITTPNVMAALRRLNRDQARPYNFRTVAGYRESFRFSNYVARRIRKESCTMGNNALHQCSRWDCADDAATNAPGIAANFRNGAVTIRATSRIQKPRAGWTALQS